MAMRPAGSESAFKAAVDHEPRFDRVGKRPERRNEARCSRVELCVTVKFGRKAQTFVNLPGDCQIELIVLIPALRALPTNPKMRFVEIEMDSRDVLAGEQTESVIYAAGSESISCAGGGDFCGVAEGQRGNSPGLPVQANLRTEPIVAESAMGAGGVGLLEK